jgi:hypothetical protein
MYSRISTFLLGSDAILLGAETLRGLYPVETISTVGRICAEVYFLSMKSCIFNKLIYSIGYLWPSFFSCAYRQLFAG